MKPVLWTKGLLLNPQHLQTQDRFLEDSLSFRISAHVAHPWGFSRLAIDREALSAGVFTVSEGEGIFPDGLLFGFPDSDAVPEPKPLEEYWGEDQASLILYLAVPERREVGANVSVEGPAETRFSADVLERRDENTGTTERPILVGRKNLKILADTEMLEGHSVLPIARVTRLATGELVLDTRFVPAVVDISASEQLDRICRRIVELLSAKSANLSGQRRERKQGLADFGISDVANFWLLYTVNTHLPVARHIHEVRRGHPNVLFQALLELAGALTTFSTRTSPADLPSYDHSDLSTCFTELDETLRDLLETVVPSRHVAIRLQPAGTSIYGGAIDNDAYLAAPELYLAVSSALPSHELIEKAPQLIKVSSSDRVEHLVKRALPGMGFTHTSTPPSAIPLKLDYQYFRLERSGEDWDSVRTARNLAAYVPSEIPDPRLELVLLLPESS